MNKEEVTGQLDQVTGKIKQKFGEATGNDRLANKGAADQIKGAAKETWGHVKDAANEVNKTAQTKAAVQKERANERAEASGRDTRDTITSAAQNVKDKIKEKLDDINQNQRNERSDIRRG